MHPNTTVYLAATAALALLCAGCSGNKAIEDKPTGVTLSSPLAAGAIDGAALLQSHAALLPQNTALVIAVNADHLFNEALVSGGGLLPEDWDGSPMKKDMGRFTTERIGLDVTLIKRMLIAVTETQQLTVLIEGDFGPIEGIEPIDKEGLKLYEPPKGEGLLIADIGKTGVLALFIDPEHTPMLSAVKSGAVASMVDTPQRTLMVDAMQKAGPGLISLAIALGEGEISQALNEALPLVPDAVALSLGDHLSLVVQGEPVKLNALAGMLDQAMGQLRVMIQQEMATLDEKELVVGMATIVGFHMINGVTESLTPTIEGRTMTLRIQTPYTTGLVPMLGVTSAIAIPAFVKYVKQSKSSEASFNLRSISDGAIAYYYTQHVDESGMPIAPHFPPSAGPTPDCCATGGKCPSDPSLWEQPGWQAVKFATYSPHYYSYEMINEGEVDGALRMTIKATGDLDCDGIKSVYITKLAVDKASGEVERSPIFLEDPNNELE